MKLPFESATVVILVPLIITVAFGIGVPLSLFIVPFIAICADANPIERNSERIISKLFLMIVTNNCLMVKRTFLKRYARYLDLVGSY